MCGVRTTLGRPGQRVVGGIGRLGDADVERGDGDPAVPQRLGESVLVDVAAARDVDDDQPRLDPASASREMIGGAPGV